MFLIFANFGKIQSAEYRGILDDASTKLSIFYGGLLLIRH